MINSEDVRLEFYRSVRSELGVVIPSNDFGIFFSRFFDKAEPRDVLDSISLALQLHTGSG